MTDTNGRGALLEAFAGLRVADVRDAMDFIGRHGQGSMHHSIRPLWRVRAFGIARTARYVPYKGAVPACTPDEYLKWSGWYYGNVCIYPWMNEIREGDFMVLDVSGVDAGLMGSVQTNPDSEVVKTIDLHPTSGDAHYNIRNARVLDNGNFLVCFYGSWMVQELDSDGAVVWQLDDVVNPFQAIRLPSGNTVISCGYDKKIIEVDPEKNIVWEFSAPDCADPEVKTIAFILGIEVLPDGGIVATTYNSHPQVFQVNRDKEVVWKYDSQGQMSSVVAIHMLDLDGETL